MPANPGPQHTPAMTRNLGIGFGGGTPGGQMAGRGAASLVPQGDAAYLWVLVILEVLAISWLRQAFKRYHGG
jgi:hypothetical protein